VWRPPDNFDELSSAQIRDLVLKFFGKLAELERVVADQRAEIARLKGLKGPPDIKPSGMDKGTECIGTNLNLLRIDGRPI
jgi:hypothetical protein